MSQTITEKNVSVSTKKTYFNPTYGCDPEFNASKNQQLLQANKELNSEDILGHDGNGRTFEVRPDPSEDPLEVVNNIRNIFAQQVLRSPKFLDYEFHAGSHAFGDPLGGHIHIGCKKDKIDAIEGSRILSQYVGLVTILLEDTQQGILRRKGGNYGGMEDCRTDKPYGFEYRAPSSWITSPHIAAGVLCLTKVVMDEVLNNDKFKPSTRITKALFSNEKEKELYEIFPDVWREITQMRLYNQYKTQLDPLNFLINKRLSWFPRKIKGGKVEQVSLQEAWGIIRLHDMLTKKVKLEDIWANWKNGGNMVQKIWA